MRDTTAAALALAWVQDAVKAIPAPANGADGAAGPKGDAGGPGPKGDTGSQGIGFTLVGAYQNGATYYGPTQDNPYYQVVEYAGSSYAAIDPAGVSGRPPGSGWVLIARKGDKGASGTGGGGAVRPELGSLAFVTPTGAPDGTKYLRDDGSWQPVAGGGGENPWEYIDFQETPTVAGQPRRLMWNATDGTLDLGMNNGAVTQQIGLEQFYRVKADSAIANGQCVMATGAVGASGVLTAAPCYAPASSEYVIGVATEDMAHNDFGFVTAFGAVRGIQTNGANYGQTWVDGTILYADTTVSGGLTNVRPDVDPVIVAMVTRAHANSGILFVRVTDDGVRWSKISGKPTTSYTKTFNSTTDWSDIGGGYYTVTVTSATHGCGVITMSQVSRDNGDGTLSVVGATVDEIGMATIIRTTSNGDLVVKTNSRFAGQLVIMRAS